MPLDQVASLLVQHGVKNITDELDFGYGSVPFANGGFGLVYRGRLQDGRWVAIKRIHAQSDREDSELRGKRCKDAAHELYTWSKCSHPGVLEILGFALSEGHILLISPWMRNGSLAECLKHCNACDRLQYCIDLSGIIDRLHSKGIVHGDIKASNILVSDSFDLQLADFGSTSLTNYVTLCFTRTSNNLQWSLRFAAPEFLLDEGCEKHTTESDVYALGMTILQILTGELPYAEEPNDLRVLRKIILGEFPSLPLDLFEGIVRGHYAKGRLWGLLERCWARSPSLRPTAADVKQALIEIKRESDIRERF